MPKNRKIDHEPSRTQEELLPSANSDCRDDTTSSGTRSQNPLNLAPRQTAAPQSEIFSEAVNLSCKGVFSSCCNTFASEKFCRQCAFLCSVAPEAKNESPPLTPSPWNANSVNSVLWHVTQQHSGTFVVSRDIRLVECDSRASLFFSSSGVFRMEARNIQCTDAIVHEHFVEAVRSILNTGTTRYVLLYANAMPQRRYCLILFRVYCNDFPEFRALPLISAVIQPLDVRRVATAKQLMELFGLSAAEARLTRALARGESLDYFVATQGIRMPTARSQLRSAFAKTGTDRQAELVRLVIGVPAIR